MTYILIHCSLSSYTSTFKFHNLCIVLTKIEVWINWSRLLTTNYLIRTLSKHREIAVRVYEMHHLYVELKEINSKIKSRQGIRIMCHVSGPPPHRDTWKTLKVCGTRAFPPHNFLPTDGGRQAAKYFLQEYQRGRRNSSIRTAWERKGENPCQGRLQRERRKLLLLPWPSWVNNPVPGQLYCAERPSFPPFNLSRKEQH